MTTLSLEELRKVDAQLNKEWIDNIRKDVMEDLAKGVRLSEAMNRTKFVGYLIVYMAIYLEEKGVCPQSKEIFNGTRS